MTEKTARQIEGMKNDYNFGVEVEMNHITRQNAAKLAAEFFGTGRYENTAYRNSYMTWSAFSAYGREWKFSRDVSIKGPDDEKCELVTPILGWDDIPTLQELLRKLRHAGAISNPSVGAGVHIHVSRKGGFQPYEIKNLVNIMASHEHQIGKAIRIDEGRTGHYCKTVNPDFLNLMHRRNPSTMEALENCWYEGNERYVGDVLTNKYYVKDHMSHKLLKNNGEVEQVLLNNHHAPIVQRELFDRVQTIKELKSSSHYPYEGFLVCPHCGRKLVYRAEVLGVKRSAWCCDINEFYAPVKKLDEPVLEACRDAKDPAMENVEYWWLDELVDSITFGMHEDRDDQTVIVTWIDGQSITVPSKFGLMKKLIHKARIREHRKKTRNQPQTGQRTVTRMAAETEEGAEEE